jgi:hypothetical protein
LWRACVVEAVVFVVYRVHTVAGVFDGEVLGLSENKDAGLYVCGQVCKKLVFERAQPAHPRHHLALTELPLQASSTRQRSSVTLPSVNLPKAISQKCPAPNPTSRLAAFHAKRIKR